MTRISLTDRAHAAVAAVLAPGDSAIDATVGNGHDTVFLAKAVAPDGIVFGFDVQAVAIAKARRRIEGERLDTKIVLINGDHASMAEHVPETLKGAVGAVMFNLGYLPGSCKTIRTTVHATLAAVAAAHALLRPGGLLSVIAYTGHAGGRAETEAVKDWALSLDPHLNRVHIEIPDTKTGNAPQWILVGKGDAALD